MRLEASKRFNGGRAMQAKLVAAISEKREMMGISPEQLDKACGFGRTDRNGVRRYPTTREFEENSNKMTSDVFSAASFALKLKIDEVLTLPPKHEFVDEVKEHMRSEGAGLVAACGHEGGQNINYEAQAPVYLILKALHEMDQIAESPSPSNQTQ